MKSHIPTNRNNPKSFSDKGTQAGNSLHPDIENKPLSYVNRSAPVNNKTKNTNTLTDFGSGKDKSDNELLHEILNIFRWNWEIPESKISIRAENGWITLEGELHWAFQLEVISKALSSLVGIKGIHNKMTIRQTPPGAQAKRKNPPLEQALDVEMEPAPSHKPIV